MAFDFQGTFTASQFARFRDYVREQIQLVSDRIAHLQAERARVGDLSFAYDSGGLPTAFTNDPPTTYVGKLFAAYEALGGDVEFDLQIRQTKQPVFRLAGDETKPAQLMSNGEVISSPVLGDAESSIIMQKMRSWVSQDLHRRRDALERKIRRAIDYAEQLDTEIAQLKLVLGSADQEDSLEFLISNINTLTADPRFMAITDDANSPDPHGKFSRAPIAGYTPGGQGASSTSYERTLNGFVKPTQ